MPTYPRYVVIEEQGLREGLQREKPFLSTEKKLALIEALVAAGLKRIQVTSFVNPKLIPQLADAEALCAGLRQDKEVIYSGLVLNVKGVERAADAGLMHVAASISASDTHSRKNANASLAEARRRLSEMIRNAKRRGLSVQGGVQCVFGCRYEGRVDPGVVCDIVAEQLDQGVDEIALADSTGMADPRSIQAVCARVLALAKDKTLVLHLHDTEGKGLANALAALALGITHFDAAFGGMGGCPFIQEASGNIATEDFVLMLSQMGIQTGIDVDRIAAISRELEGFFHKPFAGRMHRLLARRELQILRGPTGKALDG